MLLSPHHSSQVILLKYRRIVYFESFDRPILESVADFFFKFHVVNWCNKICNFWVYASRCEFIQKGNTHTIFHSQLNFYNANSVCTTCFGPIFGHHQVFHLKYLEEEYYCTISMSELKMGFYFNFIFIL